MKKFSKRLQNVFQDVFKTSSRRVCKTSCNYVFKTSSRSLQDVFARRLAIMSSRRLGRQKKCYTEDDFKTYSRRLQYVFTKTNVSWGDISMKVSKNWIILINHLHLKFRSTICLSISQPSKQLSKVSVQCRF